MVVSLDMTLTLYDLYVKVNYHNALFCNIQSCYVCIQND